jgi:hypothetical protein
MLIEALTQSWKQIGPAVSTKSAFRTLLLNQSHKGLRHAKACFGPNNAAKLQRGGPKLVQKYATNYKVKLCMANEKQHNFIKQKTTENRTTQIMDSLQ